MQDLNADSGLTLNLPVTLATMVEMETKSRNGRNSTKSSRPPVRMINANQVVAWNLARYRRAAGLTQQEFGAKVGWSGATVSEAERSWDGKRAREFDAQTLTILATALGVPIIALLLPPYDDGPDERYVIDCGRERGQMDMGEYLALAVMPDGDEGDSPATTAYREQYRAVIDRYRDPRWAARAARWVKGMQSTVMLAELAAKLRDRERSLAEASAEFRDLACAIETALEERLYESAIVLPRFRYTA